MRFALTQPHVIADEHALRELVVGVRDRDAVAALRDGERAEREAIVQRLAGRGSVATISCNSSSSAPAPTPSFAPRST